MGLSQSRGDATPPTPQYEETPEFTPRDASPRDGGCALRLHVLRASAQAVRSSRAATTPAWMQRPTRFGCTLSVPGHFKLVLPPTSPEGDRRCGAVTWRGAAEPTILRVAAAAAAAGSSSVGVGGSGVDRAAFEATLRSMLMTVQVTRASRKAPDASTGLLPPAKNVGIVTIDLWTLLQGPAIVQLRLAPNGTSAQQKKRGGDAAGFVVIEVRLEQICDWRVAIESLECVVAEVTPRAAAAGRGVAAAAVVDTGVKRAVEVAVAVDPFAEEVSGLELPELSESRSESIPQCSTSIYFEDALVRGSDAGVHGGRGGGCSAAVAATRVRAGASKSGGASGGESVGAAWRVAWDEERLRGVEVRGCCGFRQLSGGALFVELRRSTDDAGGSSAGAGARVSAGSADVARASSPRASSTSTMQMGCCWVTLEQLVLAASSSAATSSAAADPFAERGSEERASAAALHWEPGCGTESLFTFTSAIFNKGRRVGDLHGTARLSGLPFGMQMLGALR